MALSENKQLMQRGELYRAFDPELIQERYRCIEAKHRLNDSRDPTRRTRVKLFRDLVMDTRPLPPELPDAQADEDQFLETDPWIDPPVFCDYGYNIKLEPGAYLNSNCHFIDTCPVYIGARTLIGPSVHFYSGSHPLDPAIRMGTEGPEFGKPIWIEEDCWVGGHATILPGVRIGRGSTVGAGSVVTKDVPPFHLVAGVPARILKKIESAMDHSQPAKSGQTSEGAGPAMAEQAEKLEKLEGQ